jgi:hypothetical protein
MPLLTARTSTILVSTGDGIHVYSSVEEIPHEVRRRFERTSITQTYLIADRRGKEEVLRAVAGAPNSIPLPATKRMVDELNQVNAYRFPESHAESGKGQLGRWLEFLVPVAIGICLWLLLKINF